jgi:SPX domain protein involved in polyphosphate accumulation
VNAFLRGEHTVDEEFAALVKKGKKSQAEVDSMIQLANEVQYAVLRRKLQPGMVSFASIALPLIGYSYANVLQPYRLPASW